MRRPLSEFEGPRHELFDLLYELTHEYDGPLEGVADFLQRNAQPNHTVFIDYGDLPLLFYTDLIVRGGLQGIPYTGSPEWIVSRSNRAGIAVFAMRYAVQEGYVPIVLPAHPDTRWENRPDPYVHFYRTPRTANVAERYNNIYLPIVIYKRRDVPLLDSAGAIVGGGE